MSENFKPCAGGCTCEQVRYQISNEPLIVHACHCRWCQRQTGGPHVINALYEAKMIELTQGNVEIVDTPSPSGRGQVIARCPNCKIAIWSNYYFGGMKDKVRFLRVGTLDNPDLMPPDVHIYTASKMPWYIIPPEHYAVEEFYDLSTTWSIESQKRYKKLQNTTSSFLKRLFA